jgi:hypothetical protein
MLSAEARQKRTGRRVPAPIDRNPAKFLDWSHPLLHFNDDTLISPAAFEQAG